MFKHNSAWILGGIFFALAVGITIGSSIKKIPISTEVKDLQNKLSEKDKQIYDIYSYVPIDSYQQITERFVTDSVYKNYHLPPKLIGNKLVPSLATYVSLDEITKKELDTAVEMMLLIPCRHSFGGDEQGEVLWADPGSGLGCEYPTAPEYDPDYIKTSRPFLVRILAEPSWKSENLEKIVAERPEEREKEKHDFYIEAVDLAKDRSIFFGPFHDNVSYVKMRIEEAKNLQKIFQNKIRALVVQKIMKNCSASFSLMPEGLYYWFHKAKQLINIDGASVRLCVIDGKRKFLQYKNSGEAVDHLTPLTEKNDPVNQVDVRLDYSNSVASDSEVGLCDLNLREGDSLRFWCGEDVACPSNQITVSIDRLWSDLTHAVISNEAGFDCGYRG